MAKDTELFCTPTAFSLVASQRPNKPHQRFRQPTAGTCQCQCQCSCACVAHSLALRNTTTSNITVAFIEHWQGKQTSAESCNAQPLPASERRFVTAPAHRCGAALGGGGTDDGLQRAWISVGVPAPQLSDNCVCCVRPHLLGGG